MCAAAVGDLPPAARNKARRVADSNYGPEMS